MLENMHFVNINIVIRIIKSNAHHYNFREAIVLSSLLYSIESFPARVKSGVVEILKIPIPPLYVHKYSNQPWLTVVEREEKGLVAFL